MNRDYSEIGVTGIGLVTALGCGREKTWSRLLDGQSGVLKTKEGLEARIYDFSPNGARSRMGDFAILAAQEAMAHAKLDRKKRIGVAMSQSKPILDPGFRRDDGGGLDPTLLMSSFFGWSADQVVKREFNLEGPSSNPIAACASGIASISMGIQWLMNDDCDAVLVGASESSLNSFYQTGFKQMGVLTEKISRPFDRDRDGFVMGEGACVMVLEKNPRDPLAHIQNIVLRNEPSHSVQFDKDAQSISNLIKTTVLNSTVGYVNVHGTGTRMNDDIEGLAIQKVWGNSVPVSSTKAATGHLLGASGAVEAGFAVLALRDQKMPPTLNFNQADVGRDIDIVANESRSDQFNTSMSLSYGFGGQMGAVCFKMN